MNLNDSKTVHDAITSWTEIISTKISLYAQCGRKRKNFDPFVIADWLACQGAPLHGITGNERMQGWWTETN